MVGKRFQGPRELSAREVTRARSASPRARLARSKSLHNRPTTSSINARSTSSIKLRLVVSKRCKRLFHTKIRILRKLLSLLLPHKIVWTVTRHSYESEKRKEKEGRRLEKGESGVKRVEEGREKNCREIRLVGRVAWCQDPRPHCVSRPTCRSRPFSLCLFLLCQPPFPAQVVTEQAGTGLGGQTRMSHGARAEASEIFLHTESRRPNPHKSVPLAGQERPFPRARESSRVVLGWEVGRPFVRPLESRNRDSFIKSFNADDARPRGRSIIVVIEGVTLSMLDIETRYRHREKIAASIYGNIRNINETHWITNMQSFLSSLKEKPLLDRRKERNRRIIIFFHRIAELS